MKNIFKTYKIFSLTINEVIYQETEGRIINPGFEGEEDYK